MLGPSQLIHRIIPLAHHKHTESNVMCHIPIRTFFTVDTLFSLNYIYNFKKSNKTEIKKLLQFQIFGGPNPIVVWVVSQLVVSVVPSSFFFFWGADGGPSAMECYEKFWAGCMNQDQIHIIQSKMQATCTTFFWGKKRDKLIFYECSFFIVEKEIFDQ